jgi:hypothetical protein
MNFAIALGVVIFKQLVNIMWDRAFGHAVCMGVCVP